MPAADTARAPAARREGGSDGSIEGLGHALHGSISAPSLASTVPGWAETLPGAGELGNGTEERGRRGLRRAKLAGRSGNFCRRAPPMRTAATRLPSEGGQDLRDVNLNDCTLDSAGPTRVDADSADLMPRTAHRSGPSWMKVAQSRPSTGPTHGRRVAPGRSGGTVLLRTFQATPRGPAGVSRPSPLAVLSSVLAARGPGGVRRTPAGAGSRTEPARRAGPDQSRPAGGHAARGINPAPGPAASGGAARDRRSEAGGRGRRDRVARGGGVG